MGARQTLALPQPWEEAASPVKPRAAGLNGELEEGQYRCAQVSSCIRVHPPPTQRLLPAPSPNQICFKIRKVSKVPAVSF